MVAIVPDEICFIELLSENKLLLVLFLRFQLVHPFPMFILSHSVSLSLGGKTCVGLAEKVVFLIILVYPVNLLR